MTPFYLLQFRRLLLKALKGELGANDSPELEMAVILNLWLKLKGLLHLYILLGSYIIEFVASVVAQNKFTHGTFTMFLSGHQDANQIVKRFLCTWCSRLKASNIGHSISRILRLPQHKTNHNQQVRTKGGTHYSRHLRLISI